MRRWGALAAAVVVVLAPSSAKGAPAAERWLIPPVDATIARGFKLPKGQFGPGNRGLDYAVTEGMSVRAAGSGTVTWAGAVPGTIAVTIDHGEGLETTYTGLREAYVGIGDAIDQGHWIGSTGARLHFGVKLDDVYVDPRLYLGPVDVGDAIHLIPTETDSLLTRATEELLGRELEGRSTLGCTARDRLRAATVARAPNDNVAIMVGGVNAGWERGSRADIAGTAADLGYDDDRAYVYSYSDDLDRYDKDDTAADLRASARRLDSLLARIAHEHPGARVDILAHSQGGLVARYYLATAAREWDAQRPRVEHLVTFSTPHQGAPAAGIIEEVDELATGGVHLGGLHRAHRGEEAFPIPDAMTAADPKLMVADKVVNGLFDAATRVLPDPRGRSIRQMEPGSQFLRNLATDDVVYGTRVLALQGKFDYVVPAKHARWPGRTNRGIDMGLVADPHGRILDDPEALAAAHAFLRGARTPCLEQSDYDVWAWGDRISAGTEKLPAAWSLGEDAVINLALRGRGRGAPTLIVREGSKVFRLLRSKGLRGAAAYGRDKVTYPLRNPEKVLDFLLEQGVEGLGRNAIKDAIRLLDGGDRK